MSWDPYRYDVLGLLRRLCGDAPPPGWLVLTAAVLLFCGGGAVIAWAAGRLRRSETDPEAKVLAWVHDYAACLGMGLLLPLALTLANTSYRAVLASPETWQPWLGPCVRVVSSAGWALAVWLSAAVLAILSLPCNEKLQDVKYWHNATCCGRDWPRWARWAPKAYQGVKVLIYAIGFAALVQASSKLIALNLDVAAALQAPVNQARMDAMATDGMFGLASVGQVLTISAAFASLVALLLLLTWASEQAARRRMNVEEGSGWSQRCMVFLVVYLLACLTLVLRPIHVVHESMAEAKQQALSDARQDYDQLVQGSCSDVERLLARSSTMLALERLGRLPEWPLGFGQAFSVLVAMLGPLGLEDRSVQYATRLWAQWSASDATVPPGLSEAV